MNVEYQFDPLDLESSEECRRRWALISISRQRLAEYEDKLIIMLRNETESNRRHIVRALGKIGTDKSVAPILEILKNESGLILGDAAESLGKLNAVDAKEIVETLVDSPVDWIANKTRWALARLRRSAERQKGTS